MTILESPRAFTPVDNHRCHALRFGIITVERFGPEFRIIGDIFVGSGYGFQHPCSSSFSSGGEELNIREMVNIDIRRVIGGFHAMCLNGTEIAMN